MLIGSSVTRNALFNLDLQGAVQRYFPPDLQSVCFRGQPHQARGVPRQRRPPGRSRGRAGACKDGGPPPFPVRCRDSFGGSPTHLSCQIDFSGSPFLFCPPTGVSHRHRGVPRAVCRAPLSCWGPAVPLRSSTGPPYQGTATATFSGRPPPLRTSIGTCVTSSTNIGNEFRP